LKIREIISKQIIQVGLGLLIGLFVLVQSSHTQQDIRIKVVDKEQSDDSGQESQQLSLTEAVPFSVPQINLDFQSFLLEEVPFEKEPKEEDTGLDQWAPAAQKALKVLFRRIISPNAP